jgi:hypothetical protein
LTLLSLPLWLRCLAGDLLFPVLLEGSALPFPVPLVGLALSLGVTLRLEPELRVQLRWGLRMIPCSGLLMRRWMS